MLVHDADFVSWGMETQILDENESIFLGRWYRTRSKLEL